MVKVWWNAEKNIWEEKDYEGSLYLDGMLKKKLDNVNLLRKKNWDVVFMIVGMEGSGKSTLSFVCGQYLSNMGLTLNHIAAGSKDALVKLQTLPDGSVVIIDEAELLFSSRDTMTKEQRQLTKILMVIRQKRMCLILVCPSLFEISKYIAVDRSRFVLRTYTDVTLNRGYFAYWGQKKKMKLYTEGKKSNGSYAKPKADFYGRFTDYKLPFDAEYQKTKMESLLQAFEGPKKDEIKLKDKMRDVFILEFIKHNPDFTLKDYAKMFRCPDEHIKYLIYG